MVGRVGTVGHVVGDGDARVENLRVENLRVARAHQESVRLDMRARGSAPRRRRRGASTVEYMAVAGLIGLSGLLAMRAFGSHAHDKAIAQARCIVTFSDCDVAAHSAAEARAAALDVEAVDGAYDSEADAPANTSVVLKRSADTQGDAAPLPKPAAQDAPPDPWPEPMADADIELALQTLPAVAMYQYPNLQGAGLLPPAENGTGTQPFDELGELTRAVLESPDEVVPNSMGADYIAYLGNGQTVTVMVIVNGLTGQPEIQGVFTSIEGASDPLRECFDGGVAGDFAENATVASVGCQIGVGFIPGVGQAADIRDLGAAVAHRDPGGVVVSLIGFLPLGDLVKSAWRWLRNADKADEVVEVAQLTYMEARLAANEDLLGRNAFTHNRGLLSPGGYRSMLGEAFFSRLGTLQPGEIWMDMGAGSFNAIDEFYDQVPGSAGVRTAGLNFELPADNALESLADHGTVSLSGKYVEDYLPEEIITRVGGRVDLMTDVYGPLSYSSRIDEVLQLYGDVLDVGGELHINIAPHGWGLIDVNGARITPAEYFRRAGFEVSAPVVDRGNGWQFVLTRTDAPIDVPALELVDFNPQVLPERTFRLVDPAAGG